MYPNNQNQCSNTTHIPYELSLEEQLNNLTLSTPSELLTQPRDSGRINHSYSNHNARALSQVDPGINLGWGSYGLSGQAARERWLGGSSSNLTNTVSKDEEYLAMLRYYVHNMHEQNRLMNSRGHDTEHYRRRKVNNNNNVEHRVRSDNINRLNFHNNKNRIEDHLVDLRVNWDELRGNLANFVKDHQRFKFVLQMLEQANREKINMIISEVKINLGEIVTTHTGGQFFQSLMDYVDDQDVTEILRAAMINKHYFLQLCSDNHGSRAMQKLIKKIDGKNGEQKLMILRMMKEVMLTLITRMNSYYFVTELFSSLKGPAAYDLITPLFDEITDHLLEIALDKFGCCALHICIEHGHRSPQRDRLLQKIVSHSLELSQNDYGNYVVQYVISKAQEHFSDDIIRSLYGKFAYFSMNKYACYVVEKCILFGANEHLEKIIREIMEDPSFLNILLNQTGNYVVQKAITRCNEAASSSERLSSLFNKLTDGVIAKYPFLHYDRLGKHVLLHAKTEKEKHRRRTR